VSRRPTSEAKPREGRSRKTARRILLAATAALVLTAPGTRAGASTGATAWTGAAPTVAASPAAAWDQTESAAPASPHDASVETGSTIQAPPATAPATGPLRTLPSATVEAIETVITAVMSRVGVPGLSLAVGRGDALVFTNGYGLADAENFVPAKADTAYRLASVSKPMTAVAVLQLVEQGRLDLDAPVAQYCPAFPAKRWPVTLRHLLGHRGGIRHYRDGEQPLTRRFSSLREGLSLFADDPLEFEPGTRFRYSTYGYSLLGCAVEGATNRTYLEAVTEAVFVPAGMTRTGADDVQALVANRARGYVRDADGRLMNAALADMSYKVPGGGLSGTAPDVARFGLALLGGRLLETATLDDLLSPRDPVDEQTETYGLAMPVATRDGSREVWHLGGQEGASAALYLRPDDGTVVAVLANLENVAPLLLEMARSVARAVEVTVSEDRVGGR